MPWPVPTAVQFKLEEAGTGSTSRGCAQLCAHWNVNYSVQSPSLASHTLWVWLARLAIAMARAVVGRLERAVPFDC